MARTLEDLAQEALSVLNEVGAGQSGAPEDLDVARKSIAGLFASLYEREVTEYEVREPIPDVMFDPIVDCLANRIADKFGSDAETVNKLAGRAVAAERELKLLKRGRPTYQPQCSDYL